MTKREFLDIVFALAPNEANKIMDAFDEYVESAQLGTNLAEVGTDLVSRQAAIDALHEYLDGKRCLDEGSAIASLIEHYVFDTLPTAQPKRGKWILDRSGAYCCSECMEPCAGYVMMQPRDKYCKMCGSRNEVTT